MPATTLLTHGARHAEEVLWHELERYLPPTADAAHLAEPVRLLVPSISLRDHLAARAVRRWRRPLLELRIQTVFAAALEILLAAGRPRPRGEPLVPLLARRQARREPALRRDLDELTDGYATVAGTVRDFLDAGLERVHGEALDELLTALAGSGGTRSQVDRARALLRVSLAVAERLEVLGLHDRGGVVRRARGELERHGASLFPVRALFVHGFADATGVVADLLEVLLRTTSGTVLLDLPPDPADPAAGRHEAAYTARLRLRLSAVAPPLAAAAALTPAAAASWEIWEAPDPEAEVEQAARSIHRVLGEGIEPEDVAVVARDLGPYAGALRRHLRALGLPFSALSTPGPLAPAGRHLAALFELLRRGPDVPLERWLDALRRFPGRDVPLGADHKTDLRLAFFRRGASRLGDLHRLRSETKSGADGQLRLPLRQGLRARPAPGGSRETFSYAAHRRLEPALLDWAWALGVAAHDALRRLGAGSGVLATHRQRLERLTDDDLGWASELPARRLLAALLDQLEAEVPPHFSLTGGELVELLEDAARPHLSTPLGGAGGGVQILGALEARGRTFEHLFLLGLRRGLFPRASIEDPLLPDPLRAQLCTLLPDLPIKALGLDEERHLFAQLLSSAPHVTLSRPLQDGEGQPLPPSPLLQRLPGVEPRRPTTGITPELARRWPPPLETAVEMALSGQREDLRATLPVAVEWAFAGIAAAEERHAGALAAGRLAVLEELDAPPDRPPGPYFGFVGEAGEEADPRRRPLYVTTLERFATCPWQTFLRRLLRLEPLPDPLESLPTLRGLLVGRLVHRVLERIATPPSAGAAPPAPVPWPAAADLEEWLRQESEALMRHEGLALRGLARAAAEQARVFLEVARRVDWGAASPSVLAVEAQGSVRLIDSEGGERTLHFRADRVDRLEPGRRLTDYKTGAPGSRRDLRRLLLDRARAGEWLQLPAYLCSEPPPTTGRLLFLAPDLDEDRRQLQASSDDPELAAAFRAVVRTLLRSWDEGTFFPRLIEPDEDVAPPLCARCEVAEACLHGDSGARLRLRRATTAEPPAGGARGLPASFLEAWSLARHRTRRWGRR